MAYASGRKGTAAPNGKTATLDNNNELAQAAAGAAVQVAASNPEYVKHADGTWGPSGGATGASGSGDKVFYENDQAVTANYALTANTNAMTAGPITINNGVTVTIPSGANWVVL